MHLVYLGFSQFPLNHPGVVPDPNLVDVVLPVK